MARRRVLIRERLRNYLSAFSLIPVILFSTILTAYIATSSWNASRENLSATLSHVQSGLNQVLQEAYQVGKSASEDEEVISALAQAASAPADRYLRELRLDNELSYISRYFDRRIQMYVVAENGALFKSGPFSFFQDDYRGEEWYKAILESDDATWFALYGRSRMVRSIKGEYLSLGVPIRAKSSGRALGAVLVEIQVDDALKDALLNDRRFYIIDPSLEMTIVGDRVEQYENDVAMVAGAEGVQVFAAADAKPGFIQDTMDAITYWRGDFRRDGFIRAGGYALAYATIPANNWILVSAVPYLELFKAPIVIMCALIVGILALSILAMLAAGAAARTVTRPILKLNQSVHQVREDNFDVVFEKTRDDEIGDLSDQFNKMVRHIKELMARIIQEQTARRKYELLLLQAQINPHFLYNALDSILWLVRMKKNDDAVTMLTALTTFFKTGLNKGRDTIPLSQEVANVQSYMTIQTFRYKTRLTCEATVDPALSDLEVPKLILQPLIENAIYHGIKPKDGPGRIELTCEKTVSGVCIRVTDDGLGMSEEQLHHLDEQLRLSDVRSRDSYGLLNVHERLRLFFRDRCHMEIDSAPGEGTCVTITIAEEGTGDVQSGDRG